MTLSSAADLYTMGFIARSINTAAFRMGLCSDSAGAPGTLLGYTAAFTPTANTEVDITSAPVALSAGTYWMVWINSANAYGYYSSSCSTVTTYYKAYTYAALPSTWPSGASSLTGQCHNIYVGLR